MPAPESVKALIDRFQHNLPHQKDLIQRQIHAADRQIDKLVHELYGLSAEEIGIVEGRT